MRGASAAQRAPEPKPQPKKKKADTLTDLEKMAKYPAHFVQTPWLGFGYLVANEKVSGGHAIALLEAIAAACWAKPRFPKGDKGDVFGPLVLSLWAKRMKTTLQYASAVVADMTKRGIIEVVKDPDDKRVQLARLTPEKWEKAPKYVPKPTIVAKQEVEPDDDDEDDNEDDARPTLVKSKPIAVLPGRVSRTFTLDRERDKSIAVENKTPHELKYTPMRNDRGNVVLVVEAEENKTASPPPTTEPMVTPQRNHPQPSPAAQRQSRQSVSRKDPRFAQAAASIIPEDDE